MSNIDVINYGPLAKLFGQWVGTCGIDKSPEPDGIEYNDFIDELIFYPAGIAQNAEKQNIIATRYHQIVKKKDNNRIFHEQIGHWLYEQETGLIMHSLTIPRGVCILAGGYLQQKNNTTIFAVKATANSNTFGIVQSPFMINNSMTKEFEITMQVKEQEISYKEITHLYIYGKNFKHVDKSTLQKVCYEIK